MTIEHLDKQKSFALIGEMTSTRNLLGYGVKVLRSSRFLETTRDPIMTMLSIGFEKLLKLTVGVMALDETKSWPSKALMKSYGHGIETLFDETMIQIRTRAANGTDYVKAIAASVDDDVVIRPLLAALDRYGRSGRFYNLDMLADDPQTDTDPEHMWDEAELATLADPEIVRLRDSAVSDAAQNDSLDEFYKAVQGRMAGSIENCWHMISALRINDVFGKTGKILGWEIAPEAVGHQ